MPWSPAPVSLVSVPLPSRASETPIDMSGDCSSMLTITPHVSASKPIELPVKPISLIVSRAIFCISTYDVVVISPITRSRPVFTAHSHATLAVGS